VLGGSSKPFRSVGPRGIKGRIDGVLLHDRPRKCHLSARYFDISGKTFLKWLRRFKDFKYDVRSLADRSRARGRQQIFFIACATLSTSLLKTYRQIMEVSLLGNLRGPVAD